MTGAPLPPVDEEEAYLALVREARAAVESVAQPASLVLVIGDGEPAFAEIDPLVCRNFPGDADGAWTGNLPVDDSEAIALLEEARREGAAYLAIPDPTRWWLRHYQRFAAHLARTAAIVHMDASCTIFALAALTQRSEKERGELTYWQRQKLAQTELRSEHYETFYTSHFGLDRTFYRGKRILDIGCGPRGSLEWATEATVRVGLDPLADDYRALGADQHQMTYVAGGAESIPFDDDYFDVVCSFNSLDHVDDLDKVIGEVVRVLTPGGFFLLLTDIDHEPTVCEPCQFSWDIVSRFAPGLEVLEQRRYEKRAAGMYESILEGVAYDDSDAAPRYAVLSAKLRKRASLPSVAA